ncbi:MAG: AdeC/AdeK/OprM family multidrug efflux complex outer membrane factor [Pseudomonadota bacterium]|uniref:AdeC/AdeK/OprM family multidrug efflux complex outer membrane factor n=1 Tax=Thermithiobacillus tepidarius TaxID=929 RepID=UPI00040D46FC|nr:AdeC/AdeK/OprM family multidrug efflux complex outer membrane factor [Thermithiobacillus tepidarius]
MKKIALSMSLAALALSGCSMIPSYERPSAPVSQTWPQGPAYEASAADAGGVPAAQLGWREFFTDPRLQRLIQIALENNRDLREAALNVQLYQSTYRIQRAELFPAVSADAQGQRQHIPASFSPFISGRGITYNQYTATLGLTAYELDFFGRVRSLEAAALQNYFATLEARRSAQISLIAAVANAYLTWQADQQLLQVTRDTLAAYQQSYELTEKSFQAGVASGLDVRQSQTALEAARANLAQYTRQVAEDENALTLLLGAPLPADLPPGRDLAQDGLLRPLPAGLPAEVLQQRPDILQAEYALKAANANIGAARAAFFPRISLTASAGTASRELSGLFGDNSGYWTFAPRISLPIFTAGSLRASLDVARIQKDINVVRYERAIQAAFREVADGLAARATYASQLQAQEDLVKSSQDYYRLAQLRYRQGVDNYLTVLDAQRSLYNAQQGLLNVRLNQLVGQVNLYKALGGGWFEHTQASAAPAG